MFHSYGYDTFYANDYIDTSGLSTDLLSSDIVSTPIQQDSLVVQDAKPTTTRETFSGFGRDRTYMALHKKIAEQRFQIFCMWVLLAICVVVIINIRGKESQLANLMYMLHMSGNKVQAQSI